MVKRKASSASLYERPPKFIKKSTSDVGNGLSLGRRAQTFSKSPLESLNFPPLKLTKKTRTTITSSNGKESVPVAPSLRRASTLPIEDTELVSESNDKSSPSKRRSRPEESLSFKGTKSSDEPKTSPSRKSSSFLLTTVEPLKSGSSVGETKLGKTKWEFTSQNSGRLQNPTKTSFKGKMSRSPSDAGPSLLPSFTAFASKGKTSLSMSKSALLDSVEEAEITRALASLRSCTSASGKSFSKAKSASLTKDSSDNMPHEEPSSFIKSNSVVKTLESKEAETRYGSDTTDTGLSQPKPHNRLMEIVFSFDTTGSMSSCLDEVRSRIKDMVQRLRADIPGIRIAVICHGDYCDSDKYIVQWIDFGASLPELNDFVSRVERTHGGDAAECYELVLKRVREGLSWTPGSQRSLILIGDDEPHSVGYVYGSDKFINQIDWRQEVQLLKDMGVRIYGVQVDGSAYATYFYREMAEVTGGHHLKLQNFSSIFSFLMAICYKEGSPDLLPTFEAEVRAQNKKGIALDVEGLFLDLKYPRTPNKSSDLIVMKSAKLATTPASKRIKSPLRKKVAEKAKARKNTGSKTGKGKERHSKPKLTAKSKMTKSKKSKKGEKRKSRIRAERTMRSKAKKTNKIKKTVLREKVSESKFKKGPLERLKWSSWHLGVVAKLPKEGTVWGRGKSTVRNCTGKTSQRVPKCGPSNAWHTCKRYMGYRKVDLFKNDTRSKALYEIAVQLPRKLKKYVVYFRLSKGFASYGLWDTYLIHDKSVQAEMKKVLKKGCSIHVRRGVIPGHSARSMNLFSKVKDHLRKNYDYAWKKEVNRKKLHRKVEMNGVIISHGNI